MQLDGRCCNQRETLLACANPFPDARAASPQPPLSTGSVAAGAGSFAFVGQLVVRTRRTHRRKFGNEILCHVPPAPCRLGPGSSFHPGRLGQEALERHAEPLRRRERLCGPGRRALDPRLVSARIGVLDSPRQLGMGHRPLGLVLRMFLHGPFAGMTVT